MKTSAKRHNGREMSKNITHNVFVTIGATNLSDSERELNDFYATDPIAMELLLENEIFCHDIWECACGEGHLSRVLEQHGHHVISTDLIDRGYGEAGVDFLEFKQNEPLRCDIITNPPYKYARQFVEHALDIVADGQKVAMFLRLTFLEGKARRELFKRYPPKTIYVASGRIRCAKNAEFEMDHGSAVAYCWMVWEKGFTGDPIVRWIN